jgi:hypothetical protein
MRAVLGLFLLQTTLSAAFTNPMSWFSAQQQTGSLALRTRVPAVCRRSPCIGGSTRLSAQIKFADAVEEVLVRKWDKKNVGRVLQSWRRMDEDYIHKEFKKEHDTWQVCVHAVVVDA